MYDVARTNPVMLFIFKYIRQMALCPLYMAKLVPPWKVYDDKENETT